MKAKGATGRGLRLSATNWTLIFLLSCVGPGRARADCDDALGPGDVCTPRISFNIGGTTYKIPYCRNHALGTPSTAYSRAVIVIHGCERNAIDYFNDINGIVGEERELDDTIIIAPQFVMKYGSTDDIASAGLGSDILYWGSGWSTGYNSKNSSATISSFAVVDQIAERLKDNFSNMRQIVVVGHSAGGQFVNRYAAGSKIPEDVLYPAGVDIRYIVANPSSYLYLNEERWDQNDTNQYKFWIPDSNYLTDFCSDYDNNTNYDSYKYGLKNIKYSSCTYMRDVDPVDPGGAIVSQYQQREVIYLLGDKDTGSASLDTGCRAMLQGEHRYERGTVYYEYLQYYYGSSIRLVQRKSVVQGVDHNHTKMFRSDEGRKYIFHGLCRPMGVSATKGTSPVWVSVSWDPVAGATGYRAYRSESAAGPWTQISSQIGTGHLDYPPTPGKAYFYSVVATDGVDDSARSPYDTGWCKLSAPGGVSASDGAYQDKVRVSWNPVNGASHYRVYRGESSGGTKTALGNWQTGSGYDDNPPTAGKVYYYWVGAAVDGSGTRASEYSNFDAGYRKLESPTGVTASDGAYTNKVHISWNGVSGASHYGVYRATSAGGAKTLLTALWVTDTSYEDGSASPGLTYYYWAKAAVSLGGARAGDFSSGDTGWRMLVALTGVSASDGEYTDKVRISWNAVIGATYYRVYRAASLTGVKTALGNWQSGTSYDDSSATPGKDYYYWVKGSPTSDGARSTGFSSPDAGRRKLSAPTGISASDGSYRDKVRITWNAAAGATHYRIWRSTSATGTKITLMADWRSGTSYDDGAAVPETTYYYWVKAATSSAGARASDFSGHDSGWRKTPLSPPTGLAASDGAYTTHVHVTWTGGGGTSHYRVYRSDTSGGARTELGNWQTATSYDDIPPVPGASYYYWVKGATNSTGDDATDFSLPDTGWRRLSAPEGLLASDGEFTDRVRTTWLAASGATHYQLSRSWGQYAEKTAVTGWQTTTSFDDTEPTPGDSYYYWVKAATSSVGARASDFSVHDSGWRKLLAPTGVSASNGTYTDKVRITWDKVEGALYYQVCRATSPTGEKTEVGFWNMATTYEDTSSVPGTTYYYWVKAAVGYTGGRASEYSSYDSGWRPLSAQFHTAASEGLETTSPASIKVVLSGTSTQTVTVDYAATGGTAQNGLDYTLSQGTVIFEPGQTSMIIDANVIYDGLEESDETIEVTLSNPTGPVVIGMIQQHTYTILDNTKYLVCTDGSGDFPNIQAAIDSVVSRDVIELCDGTFTGAGNREVDYKGKAITIRSKSGDAEKCTIDCANSMGKPYTGFKFVSDEGPGSILASVTIGNGAYGIICGARGYPPLNPPRSGSPTIRDCILSNNKGGSGGIGGSVYNGGGMLCVGKSAPIIIRCRFFDNSAGAGGFIAGIFNGGGVCCEESSPSLHNCSFVDNTAPAQLTSGGNGGAMYCDAGAPILDGCTFSGNSAKGAGGAFACEGGRVALSNCVFSANHTGTGSTMSGNGGAAAFSDSGVTMSFCTFVGNQAMTGGAVWCHGGYLAGGAEVANCTFYENAASTGGAIYVQSGPPATVTNTIIADNKEGGAVACYSAGATLTCCDVYSNAGGDWVGCIAGQDIVRNNISLDPVFCRPAMWDLLLRRSSPCVPFSPPNSQCGLIGAWPAECLPGDLDRSGRVDMIDFALFGRAWLSERGEVHWDPECDISTPADDLIDMWDLAAFVEDWQIDD